MMDRARTRAVNERIRRDSAALLDIVDLIDSRTPLADWPHSAAELLGAALSAPGLEGREADKARWLARHLFGPDAAPPLPPAPNSTAAERVRADLIGLVPLHACRRMMPRA